MKYVVILVFSFMGQALLSQPTSSFCFNLNANGDGTQAGVKVCMDAASEQYKQNLREVLPELQRMAYNSRKANIEHAKYFVLSVLDEESNLDNLLSTCVFWDPNSNDSGLQASPPRTGPEVCVDVKNRTNTNLVHDAVAGLVPLDNQNNLIKMRFFIQALLGGEAPSDRTSASAGGAQSIPLTLLMTFVATLAIAN